MAFYDDRAMLERGIVDYALEGLNADETVVLIVASSSLPAVRDALAAHGVDVDELGRQGFLVLVDADATLASVSTHDGIDWSAVRALAERVVGDTKGLGRPLRQFGEIVAILWERGDVQLAMDLERLWDELAHEHGFDVLCAYPTVVTTALGAADPINAMCVLHDATVSIEKGRQSVVWTLYPCEPAAVAAARDRVRDTWSAGDLEKLGDALMIVSELAVNAVEHACTPFTLEVQRSGVHVRLIVGDGSPVQPVLRHSDPTTPGGRGLALVDVLADSWGVIPTAHGKQVWASVKFA